MADEFLMPKLGLTMEEGTIVEWLVPDGGTVAVGTPVVRIETDKTETDVEAVSAGRVQIVARPGDTFACGERIGWLLAPDEAPVGVAAAPTPATAPAAPTPGQVAPNPSVTAVGPTAAGAGPAASTGRIIASPLAKRLAAERGIDLRRVRGTGPDGRIVAADLDDHVDHVDHVDHDVVPEPAATAAPSVAIAPVVVPGGSSGDRPWPATAAARQLADLLGIDVTRVALDPISRTVTRDGVALQVRALLAAASGPAPAPAVPAATTSLAPATQTPTSTVRLTGMRGTIAKRMSQSLHQMAQLTLFMDADLDAVVADRARRAEAGKPPSYTDYVIAAAARALGLHPIANSQITDDGVALLPVAHVGMAVALDGGLVVPVIRNTASLDLATLASESARLATAARSGSLTLPDLEGGTFSVSTLGMFGVDGFTPVINPPNTCILGVGRLRSDLVLGADGAVTSTQRVTLSLTWDHRAFDGAPAAEFCAAIARLLGDPAALDTPAG
jgi:pyruvate dehydrogenase E2 component (dihydrolipoamide acetyltransferase)